MGRSVSGQLHVPLYSELGFTINYSSPCSQISRIAIYYPSRTALSKIYTLHLSSNLGNPILVLSSDQASLVTPIHACTVAAVMVYKYCSRTDSPLLPPNRVHCHQSNS
ncbi:hypothetical protein PM082_020653 [Marasmius tenuissimus]|nr:hypothetical protein PM082_020653 [Marasmius tenuissimus]